MTGQIDLGEYLFRRLAQLGVGSLHGVPGDYNLTVLDYLESAGLHWVGNANELNSGYAADGYARIKGIAALITSFGVGELSAINAIGGAYSEKAPVIHIVGTPPRAAQEARACLHHSLGDGNFRVFADMYKSITVAQANLIDPKTAPALIDATLKECILKSRPVYIEIPTDMVRVRVPSPLFPIDLTIPGYNEASEDNAASTIINRIQQSSRLLLLVDGFTARFDIRDEINELVKLTGIPTLTTPFGKSLVNEGLPSYCGIHSGLAGDVTHQAWVEGCDLVLHFGPLKSDINTFGFTALANAQNTITFQKHSIHFGDDGNTVSSISVKLLLNKVNERLRIIRCPNPEPYPKDPFLPRELLKALPESIKDAPIDQYSFWLRMSAFFRPGDIILTETGTASYGGQSFILPQDTTVINSSIWLSIGYMLAACQGAALAQREMIREGTRASGRTVLLEGDGSLQMSAQSISDMIRNRLDVIIFVLNNNGYTIERIIHGFEANYNDVQPWRNLEAPSYFGAPKKDPSYRVRALRVSTWGELDAVFQTPEIQSGKGFNMIEVMMDVGDAPLSLQKFVEYLKKRNGGDSH